MGDSCEHPRRPGLLGLANPPLHRPDAHFAFVTDPGAVPPDAVPFDMRGVEFGHHAQDCTFETLLRRHDLDDPVLWRIAQIIHEADLDALLGGRL